MVPGASATETVSPGPPADVRRARRSATRLSWAGIGFAAAVILHNGDHLRRGVDSVGRDVFWVGTAAVFVEVAAVAFTVTRHRLAPLAATAAGFPLAVGYLVVHFTPSRSWFSDSLVSGDASTVSIFAAALETTAALCLGVAGVLAVRSEGLASAMRSTPATDGSVSVTWWRHPVVVVMVVANVAIVALSLAQL